MSPTLTLPGFLTAGLEIAAGHYRWRLSPLTALWLLGAITAIEYGTPRHHWNFGDMPPVPGLVPEEMDAIIAYVRSEQVKQGFEQ